MCFSSVSTCPSTIMHNSGAGESSSWVKLTQYLILPLNIQHLMIDLNTCFERFLQEENKWSTMRQKCVDYNNFIFYKCIYLKVQETVLSEYCILWFWKYKENALLKASGKEQRHMLPLLFCPTGMLTREHLQHFSQHPFPCVPAGEASGTPGRCCGLNTMRSTNRQIQVAPWADMAITHWTAAHTWFQALQSHLLKPPEGHPLCLHSK